jgi:hypothetical protein
VYFAAVSSGVGHAFELAALELAGLLVGVSVLTRVLPGRAP